jgi:hypothetical protein
MEFWRCTGRSTADGGRHLPVLGAVGEAPSHDAYLEKVSIFGATLNVLIRKKSGPCVYCEDCVSTPTVSCRSKSAKVRPSCARCSKSEAGAHRSSPCRAPNSWMRASIVSRPAVSA